jgi:hypothetical protein
MQNPKFKYPKPKFLSAASIAFKTPPQTCSAAAAEARNVLRLLRMVRLRPNYQL